VLATRDDLEDDPFVVLNGGDLPDPESLAALYDAAPAVGVYKVDDPPVRRLRGH
jgi:hypothetical protein